MALKLKLKVKPSQPPEGRDVPRDEPTSSPRHPKIKSESSDRVSKPKHKKEKLKKLRLSLGKASSPSFSPSVSSAPPAPAKPILKKIPKVRIKPTRIPGEGYDSEAPDVEDDPLIEQGILIRFMDDANLDFVHNAVATGDLSNVNIKWITREKAVINVNSTLYSARLLDLPTLTELYKTVDKKNIFKTIDISQILLVLHPINPKQLNMDLDFEVPENSTYTHPIYELSTNKEIRNTKSVYKHGLSYAFEDVYRRFKPRKVNHRVMQDIESRVDELVRRDAEAQESHYEYVDPSTQTRRAGSHSHHATPSQSIPSTPSARALSPRDADEYDTEAQEQEMDMDLEADIDNALEQELAEALDSTSNNTAATVLMKSEFDNEEEVSDDEAAAGQADGDDDEEDEEEEDDEDEEEEEDAGDGTKEEKSKAKKLEEEISDLESAAEKQKKLLSTASFRMMRMKFQAAYNNLKAQLDQKKRELAKIKEQQQKTQAPTAQHQSEEEDDEDDDDDVDGDDDDEEDNGQAESKKIVQEKSSGSSEAQATQGEVPQENDDDQEMDNEDYDDLQDLF